MKHVFVSILNFNGKEDTLACLESLSKINQANFKLTVVVVDNASTDGLVEEIQKSKFKNQNYHRKSGIPFQRDNLKLKIIKNEKNLGFSGGNNVGIKYALESKTDYILILNNDTYADEEFLTELIKAAEKDNNVGILVPKIYFAPGFEFHKDRYSQKEKGQVFWYAGGKMDWQNVIGHNRGVDLVDKGQFKKEEETEIATGCCMLVKREIVEKIGIFDEKYFLYYEDADLSMRVKKAGFKIMYVPSSVIWHKNAGSAGGSGSVLQDYYITRNRLMFGFRYAPIRSKLALFKESLSLLLKGRKWQRQGVIDFYLGRLEKGSYKV